MTSSEFLDYLSGSSDITEIGGNVTRFIHKLQCIAEQGDIIHKRFLVPVKKNGGIKIHDQAQLPLCQPRLDHLAHGGSATFGATAFGRSSRSNHCKK